MISGPPVTAIFPLIMIAYAKNVLNASESLATTYNLTLLGDLYKGYFDWANMDAAKKTLVDQIYSDAGFTHFTEAGYTNDYKETTYGGYITSYLKITSDRWSNDSSTEKDFTSSGTYDVATGMVSAERLRSSKVSSCKLTKV